MTDDYDLPLGARPSVLVGLAVQRWGGRGLMDRCVRLYGAMDRRDEPELMSYLAGRKGRRWIELGFGTQGYFVRTWALRAMLYAWERFCGGDGDRCARGRALAAPRDGAQGDRETAD